MHSEFMEALENSPVIAAVKDDDGLKKCLEANFRVLAKPFRIPISTMLLGFRLDSHHLGFY